jgi:hypothetical protein
VDLPYLYSLIAAMVTYFVVLLQMKWFFKFMFKNTLLHMELKFCTVIRFTVI